MTEDVKILSTATVDFMANGSIRVFLSTPDGVTAKKISTVEKLLYTELMRLRAKARWDDSQKRLTDVAQPKTENANAN